MKPDYSRTHLMIKITLLAVFFLTGCSKAVSSTQTLTSVATQQFPTLTPPLQASTTPTSTERHWTATPTIALTSTPQPTLTVDEARALLLDLLHDNGGCRLPCLWGLTPGKTDIRSMDAFFARFGDISIDNDFIVAINEDHGRYTNAIFGLYKSDSGAFSVAAINFSYPRTNDESSLFVWSATASRRSGEGINEVANVTYGDLFFDQLLQNYMLPQILSNYGRPTQVLILPYYDNSMYPPDYIVPLSLVLSYQGQGFFIEYILPRETVGDHYVGCPWKAGYLILKVWPPESERTLAEVIGGGSVGINGLKFTKPIEEATSMTLDEFYQKFKDPVTTECLETPKDLWQP